MKDREIIKLSALVLVLVSVVSIASIDMLGMGNAIALVSVSAFLSIVAYSYSSGDTYLPLIGGVLALGIIMGGAYAYGGSQALGIAQMDTGVNISSVNPPPSGTVDEQSSNDWKIIMDEYDMASSDWGGTLYSAEKIPGVEIETRDGTKHYWVRYNVEFSIEELDGHWNDVDFNSGHETVINVTLPRDYSLQSTKKIAEEGNLGLRVTAPSGNTFTITNEETAEKGLHSITVQFTLHATFSDGGYTPGPDEGAFGGIPGWVLAILAMPIIGVVTYFGIQRFGGV